MEMTTPCVRYRANFSVSTKGVYTPDVTVELSYAPLAEDMTINHEMLKNELSALLDDVKTVAESKGYLPSIIEEK